MQKFVKLNATAGTAEQATALHPTQVKLFGYLKKKRTKVGGWRKMWFVLQNQLLLSYPSKEDYDKKLVSFKDVLNLVPGTIVRPLGGYRFAIQTTSESVYIFRCDDNKTYMEWITALVDSLSIGSSAAKKKDTPGGAVAKKPLHGSHSCSSLVRSKKNKAVHIPIAHGTARIFNRTGLSENDLRAFSSSGCLFHDINERAHCFCLHENQLLLQNQSNAVSRINRMFCGSTSDVELKPAIRSAAAATGTSDTGLVQQSATTPATAGTNFSPSTGLKGLKCASDGEIGHKSGINKKMHDLLSFIKAENMRVVADHQGLKEAEITRDINSNRSFDFEKFLESGSEAFTRNQNRETQADMERNETIEDQIQRMSLRGSSGFVINDAGNTSADHDVSCLRLSTTLRTETGSPFLKHRRKPEHGCSSSAGSCSSSERKHESSYNGDDISETSEAVRKNPQDEPIYAVVDLKNKYEHRARLRHEMEERRKSEGGYLRSVDELTTDYEEVLHLPTESFDDDINDNTIHSYDEENIYEPINIPEASFRDHKHRNILWKYISRINIDALMEMARSKKKPSKSSEHISPFANIKQKFGHHRKSIRIRMIKLYTREQAPHEDAENSDSGENKVDEV